MKIPLPSKLSGLYLKSFTSRLFVIFFLFILTAFNNLFAQAPHISYAGPQTYTAGIAISPLSPTNTGGAVPATTAGSVSTVSVNTPNNAFSAPWGVAVDASGNVYVSDYDFNVIFKVTPSGTITTLAGSGAHGSANGPGATASFNGPYGMVIDASGNLYVADPANSMVRKITPAGVVSTLTSNFNGPDVALDAAGNLYGVEGNMVVRISAAGVVTTLAGSAAQGSANGTGAAASFYSPNGVTVDASGNVYVTDSGNNLVRKITQAGVVTTLAGSGANGATDSTGTAASFGLLAAITIDASGNLYVADATNNLIRKITPAGVVTTYAGSGAADFLDGIGTQAAFNRPFSITTDPYGNVYVGDYLNEAIRKIIPLGYTISPGLPAGLSFDGTTGIISGTPSAPAAATNYTIVAHNVIGYNTPGHDTAIVNITVKSNVVSSNANLSNLIVSNGSLTPLFVSSTTSYTDTVTNISSLTITPITSDPKAGVNVNGAMIPDSSTVSIPLTVGQNTITVIVTAPDGTTTKTYTITVTLIDLVTGPVTGTITACAGSASFSPHIEQFTIYGNHLTGNITATAPAGFEISLTTVNGYSNSVMLIQSAGTVNAVIYVRSAASAPAGGIMGNVMLNTPAAVTQNVMVTGYVDALPIVNPVANQTINNDVATTAIDFTGSGGVTWTNNTPGIGLAANGTGNIPSFKAINNGSTPITATIIATPALVFAYVGLGPTDSIGVINIATDAIVDKIPVPTPPVSFLVSPDGSRVYVENTTMITVISTLTNTTIATIPIPNAGGMAISPDGSRIYLTYSLNSFSPGTVAVINTLTNLVIATITVGLDPGGISVSPDGSRVYVANSNTSDVLNSSNVSVISTATNSVIATIPVGSNVSNLSGILVSPDGTKVYVAQLYTNIVSVLSTSTNSVIATIGVGNGSTGLLISPDGQTLYVTNSGNNTVSVVNITTNTVIATILVGQSPQGISITPDGQRIYVSNTESYNISVISTATNTVIGTISLPRFALTTGNFITNSAVCSSPPIKFTITVNPTTSNNDNLTSLKLSSGTLSPAFARDIINYTALVLNAITSITVTPFAAERSAVITVNGATVASGSPSAGIPLSVGPNIITTVLTADGTSKTYTVTVTRKASDYAFLANLELSRGTLSPAFASGTFDYTSRETRTTSSITVTPTTGNAFATVKVNDMEVGSGTASSPVSLTDGINHITIVVTAQNGINTKTYSLVVTKEPVPVSDADRALSANDGQLAEDGIIVHQGVSPNGDGINDILVIDGITAYPENKLLIINRNGILVFESQGYDNSSKVFDGHSSQNGTMQLPGTYFYSLEYKVGKVTKHTTGFIILKY